MKILTKEEEDAHYNTVLRGGAEGFAAGLAVSLPASFYLNRSWHYYRSLPLSLKALGVIVVTVPACVIQAEWASLKFEKQQWHDIGKAEMDAEKRKELERISKLEGQEKWLDWAQRRRYSIVGASWAASMALAFGIVMRNPLPGLSGLHPSSPIELLLGRLPLPPYQSFPQKIVQARMWAQGLTVGVLIASAGLATTEAKGAKNAHRVDHSWALILEEQRKEEAARKARAAQRDAVSSS